METKTDPRCSFPPSGSFVFRDAYDIIYEISWTTTASGLDITIVTKQPRVWAEADQGFKQNHTLFRRGLISSQRQIIANNDSGYIILSEGHRQEIGFYQASFPCGPLPIDPFCYHLNCGITDQIEFIVNCGPRWTDPDNPDDLIVSWGDVEITDGDVLQVTPQLFQWIDVWADEIIESTCPTGGSDV